MANISFLSHRFISKILDGKHFLLRPVVTTSADAEFRVCVYVGDIRAGKSTQTQTHMPKKFRFYKSVPYIKSFCGTDSLKTYNFCDTFTFAHAFNRPSRKPTIFFIFIVNHSTINSSSSNRRSAPHRRRYRIDTRFRV